MPDLPMPLYDGDLSAEDKARIAGFLLHYRAAFLRMADSLSCASPEAKRLWVGANLLYIDHADSVTRFLLHKLGYPVKKGETLEGWTDDFDPFLGEIGRIAESRFSDPHWVDGYRDSGSPDG